MSKFSTLSKWPYFHRAYLVRVTFLSSTSSFTTWCLILATLPTYPKIGRHLWMTPNQTPSSLHTFLKTRSRSSQLTSWLVVLSSWWVSMSPSMKFPVSSIKVLKICVRCQIESGFFFQRLQKMSQTHYLNEFCFLFIFEKNSTSQYKCSSTLRKKSFGTPT